MKPTIYIITRRCLLVKQAEYTSTSLKAYVSRLSVFQ